MYVDCCEIEYIKTNYQKISNSTINIALVVHIVVVQAMEESYT